mgnify:CR=1 FL=1
MQHSTEHENILLRNLWIDKKNTTIRILFI